MTVLDADYFNDGRTGAHVTAISMEIDVLIRSCGRRGSMQVRIGINLTVVLHCKLPPRATNYVDRDPETEASGSAIAAAQDSAAKGAASGPGCPYGHWRRSAGGGAAERHGCSCSCRIKCH